jgi:hypothetical protein
VHNRRRRQRLGWRLLGHAGWPLGIAGAIFIARFWDPTPGPYIANERYPFGSHLNAWAVSFGFTWIAFGLLLGAIAALGERSPRRIWNVSFVAWGICWLPHAIIGIAALAGGLDPTSGASYRRWAADPLGATILLIDAAMLLAHHGFAIAGFVLTAGSRSDPSPPPTPA